MKAGRSVSQCTQSLTCRQQTQVLLKAILQISPAMLVEIPHLDLAGLKTVSEFIAVMPRGHHLHEICDHCQNFDLLTVKRLQ